MNFLNSIFYLFFPKTCVFCNTNLHQGEEILCVNCRHQLPLTDFINAPNNIVEKSFEGRTPIVAGTALLYYSKRGVSQELIHHLKYKNRQDIGLFFGKWMGKQIKSSHRFNSIEGIVLVPLHSSKLKQRGYNQLTTFGLQLSKELNIPLHKHALLKKEKSDSQTKKNRLNRFERMNDSFELNNTKHLYGKHLLLIDDVITTGATLESCANELLKINGVHVSIATMVVADKL